MRAMPPQIVKAVAKPSYRTASPLKHLRHLTHVPEISSFLFSGQMISLSNRFSPPDGPQVGINPPESCREPTQCNLECSEAHRMSHTPSAEFLFEFLYTPPQLDDLQNDGGPFLYRWGWGPPCKTLDKSLPLFTIKRDKQWSYLSRKERWPRAVGQFLGVYKWVLRG